MGEQSTNDVSGNQLIVEDVDHVRIITIDRPDRLNTLSIAIREQLVEEYLRCRVEKNVRVVILTATGTRAFCAGGDLKEVHHDDQSFRDPMDRVEPLLFETMLLTYKPTIAAVNGLAIGGGFELALACDLRLASENATFAMPEAKIGLGATFGSVMLPRRLPVAIALRMLYTGETMSARDALGWGLVNEVVQSEELMSSALALAQQIAANAPITVRRMKHMALKGLEMSPSAAMRLEVGPNPYYSRDREEGVAAFVEKRAPVWTDE